MSKLQAISDPQYVAGQYKNASNLNARIRLHQQSSVNKYGWQRWLFDQFNIPFRARILELGCGGGNLWFENTDRIPASWEIVLSDFSAGMLQQARQNLDDSRQSHSGTTDVRAFHFLTIDAQAIPFERDSFDVVIANHMLYHLPDRARGLSEIQRILRPGGRLYASTIGEQHLHELAEMICKFDSRIQHWGRLPGGSFTLESGSAELSQWFANVNLRRYEDALIVTDAALLAEYILSGRLELPPDQQLELVDFIQQEMQAKGGEIYVAKASGLFEASRIV